MRINNYNILENIGTGSFSLVYKVEKNTINEDFFVKNKMLVNFSLLDDYDILTCLKNCTRENDKVLQFLANTIINRKLLKIESIEANMMSKKLDQLRKVGVKKLNINSADIKYLVFPIIIKNQTYNFIDNEIKFLKKDNTLINLSDIQQEFSVNTKNSSIIKHYICYPQDCVNY